MLATGRVVEEPAALEQVLVVGVDPSADVAGRAQPLSRPDVDFLADEAEGRAPLVEVCERIVRAVEEDGLAGEPRERAELQNEGPDLGRIRAGFAHRARLQVDVHERHARRGVEGRKQARAEVFGQPQQARVPGQLMARQQAAEQSDRDLEVLDRQVPVERELLDDELLSLSRLLPSAPSGSTCRARPPGSCRATRRTSRGRFGSRASARRGPRRTARSPSTRGGTPRGRGRPVARGRRRGAASAARPDGLRQDPPQRRGDAKNQSERARRTFMELWTETLGWRSR